MTLEVAPDIGELFDAFASRVADVQEFRALVESAADREIRHLHEQQTRLTAAGLPEDEKLEGHQMLFRDARTKQPVFYAIRDLSVYDRMQSLIRNTNRQHQWLLAETYELFKDFLAKAYGYVGFYKREWWPQGDAADVVNGALCGAPYSEFAERGRRKRTLVIMALLKERCPLLQRYEGNNSLDVDLRVSVALISEMRHVIVHDRGLIADRIAFETRVLESLGYSAAGTKRAVPLQLIKDLLVLDRTGAIRLLSIPGERRGPLRVHYDLFEEFVRELMAYSHLVRLSLAPLKPAGPFAETEDIDE